MTSSLPWFLTTHPKSIYTARTYLCLDFETTNYDYGSALDSRNALLLACWSIHEPDGTLVERKHKFGDEFAMRELLEDIKQVGFIVAQNLKFELAWLRRCGLDLRTVLGADTMLAEWVIHGNLTVEKNLDAMARRYGVGGKTDTVSRLISLGVNPEDIPESWLLEYCYNDIDITHKIFRKQLEILTEREQLHIFHTRNLTCICLADIEFEGVHLDHERVKEEFNKAVWEMTDTKATLDKEFGVLNWNSTKQLADFLYDTLKFKELIDPRTRKPLRTGAGKPKTDKATILALKATNKKQERFVELYRTYNKASSLLSKSLEFFLAVCEKQGGTFHAVLNQGRTATHRLSSAGRKVMTDSGKELSAQFQNIPREFKKLFKAKRDGYLIAEVDGASLEFRIAADLCQDKQAIEDITNQIDVHTRTAETLTAAGQPTTRQEAKARTFAPLFFGKGKTDAEKAYVQFFTTHYSGIYQEQTRWIHTALETKQLRTRMGFLSFWPATAMSRSGYIEGSTQISNLPIQSSATAEVIPISLCLIWYLTAGMNVFVCNTIHDSIIAEVHPTEQERYEQVCKLAMTTYLFKYFCKMYSYEFQTPLGLGLKFGEHWGEGKEEIVYDVFPDGTERKKVKA